MIFHFLHKNKRTSWKAKIRHPARRQLKQQGHKENQREREGGESDISSGHSSQIRNQSSTLSQIRSKGGPDPTERRTGMACKSVAEKATHGPLGENVKERERK